MVSTRTNVNCNCNSRLSKGDRSKGLGTETGLLPKEFRAQFKRSAGIKTRFANSSVVQPWHWLQPYLGEIRPKRCWGTALQEALRLYKLEEQLMKSAKYLRDARHLDKFMYTLMDELFYEPVETRYRPLDEYKTPVHWFDKRSLRSTGPSRAMGSGTWSIRLTGSTFPLRDGKSMSPRTSAMQCRS